MKKVLIAGAAGAMGQKAVALVNSLADTQLTAVLAPHATADQRAELGLGPDVKIYQKREQVDPNVADIGGLANEVCPGGCKVLPGC